MSTRGAIGFRVGGADRIAYNDADSYPDCLCNRMMEFIAEGIERLGYAGFLKRTRERVEALRDIPYDDDLEVIDQDPEILLAAGVYMDRRDHLFDPLFCEWAYIINLDDEVLEVYVGGSRRGVHGRYQKEALDGRAVGLIASIKLLSISTSQISTLIDKIIGGRAE